MSPWRSWVYGGSKKDGRFTDTAFVYVLRAPGNLSKIGCSTEPVWRIRWHRRNCGSPLELICLVRHPKANLLEKKLHYHFRDQKKIATIEEIQDLGWRKESRFTWVTQSFEWFWLTDDDVTWLRSKSTEEVDCVDGR
jgi:hypothetical protein